MQVHNIALNRLKPNFEERKKAKLKEKRREWQAKIKANKFAKRKLEADMARMTENLGKQKMLEDGEVAEKMEVDV